MRAKSLTNSLLPLILPLLASCAVVDQFGERVYDGNRNTQLAQNQETLVNIVRASRLQPLNFMGISQVAGSQNENLNTGLPTITFGPLQTVAQHQFQVTNSLQSSVSGSYQSAPLVATAFSTGMLSPISPRTIAFLLASYPREPVFFATIDSLYVKKLSTGETIRLVNDPASLSEDCIPLITRSQGRLFSDAERCNFALFVNMLGRLSNAGLSAELITSEKGVAGRLCFDSTRSFRAPFGPRCNEKKKGEKLFAFGDVGQVEVTLVLRSAIGVFNYLGTLVERQPPRWQDFYFTYQARNLVGEEPFLNIKRDYTEPCFVNLNSGPEQFCVPAYSKHTALLFTILLHLRNLNIQPSDLNSAFTVRLSGT